MTSRVTAEREKAVADWENAAGGDCAPEGDEAQKQKTWEAVLAKAQDTTRVAAFEDVIV